MRLLEVCVGSSCHLKGAYDVIKELQRLIAANHLNGKIELKACFCLGNCKEGVNIRLDGTTYASISKEKVEQFFKKEFLD